MAGGGGQEENYWPGFVDALSNVVLTLIFVLVVFVFALAMASNKVAKRMEEVQVQQAKLKMVGTDVATAMEQNVELKKELDAAQAQIAQLKSEKTTPTPKGTAQGNTEKVDIISDQREQKSTVQGAIQIQQNADYIQLSYPLSVADVDDKSMAELSKTLTGIQQRMGKRPILLRAVLGSEPYSAARRLAYYRAITIRNFLISKGYGDSATITSKIVSSDHPDIGHVEIIFQH